MARVLLVVVMLGLAVALPVVASLVVDRQPWPRRARLLTAALHSQLAAGGGWGGLDVQEATIVEVHGDDVRGDERPWCLVSPAGSADTQRLQLDGTALDAVNHLRYWKAEALPVLLIREARHVVHLHGPSAVVQCAPLVAG